jgi:cytochrome P450
MAISVSADRSWVPAHVPANLVWDHDLNDYARTLSDPFQIGAHLRNGPKLIWSRGATRGQPGWVPTRFDLLQEVFQDAKRFSSLNNVGIGELLGEDFRLIPIDIDPPDHLAYRTILQPFFTPAAVNKLESKVRGIARDLIASFEKRGSCEFVTEFANPFPSYVFLDLFGLPREMLTQFLEWENAFVRGRTREERANGIRAIKNYLESYVEGRRANDQDDLVSAILKGRINGARSIMPKSWGCVWCCTSAVSTRCCRVSAGTCTTSRKTRHCRSDCAVIRMTSRKPRTTCCAPMGPQRRDATP